MGTKSVGDDAWEKRLRAIGIAVAGLDRMAESGESQGVVLEKVKVNLVADSGTSVLVVLVGRLEGREVVSFVGGYDMGTALLTLRKKVQEGALKWRESRPYGE